MTPLQGLIKSQIRSNGPMSVAEYMAICLGHVEHGYYMTRDPIGRTGDFITAPEISQMFGELLGLWLAQVGQDWPEAHLVELGPGRGTLMADALRAVSTLSQRPLWLIETSPVLRVAQSKALPEARHADSLDALPQVPLLVVANEFFDALPVRQFLITAEGWREVQIGLHKGQLSRGLSAPLPGFKAQEQDWFEHSAASDQIADELARRISTHGGAALIIDYGYRAATRPEGLTLQALRAHEATDPLSTPGEADLTWLVDFDHLAKRLAPLSVHHAEQGSFLAALGIGERAASLAKAQPSEADALADALERLTGPQHMGTLFRVISALPRGHAVPPGFASSPSAQG